MCQASSPHSNVDKSYHSESVNFLSFSWASWKNYHHPSAFIGVCIGVSIILILFCFYGNQAYICLIPKYFRRINRNQTNTNNQQRLPNAFHRRSNHSNAVPQELSMIIPPDQDSSQQQHGLSQMPEQDRDCPIIQSGPSHAIYNTREIANLKAQLALV